MGWHPGPRDATQKGEVLKFENEEGKYPTQSLNDIYYCIKIQHYTPNKAQFKVKKSIRKWYALAAIRESSLQHVLSLRLHTTHQFYKHHKTLK